MSGRREIGLVKGKRALLTAGRCIEICNCVMYVWYVYVTDEKAGSDIELHRSARIQA